MSIENTKSNDQIHNSDINETKYEEKRNSNLITEERFLCFSLGEEEYAMPLLRVKEVMAVPETTPIPQSPNYFLGIMNLRGQIVSVIDLRKKMTIKPSNRPETAVIICDFKETLLGIVVDSVNSVLNPEPNEIKNYPNYNGEEKVKQEYINGVYRRENQLIIFLDLPKILNINDKKILKESTKNR